MRSDRRESARDKQEDSLALLRTTEELASLPGLRAGSATSPECSQAKRGLTWQRSKNLGVHRALVKAAYWQGLHFCYKDEGWSEGLNKEGSTGSHEWAGRGERQASG